MGGQLINENGIICIFNKWEAKIGSTPWERDLLYLQKKSILIFEYTHELVNIFNQLYEAVNVDLEQFFEIEAIRNTAVANTRVLKESIRYVKLDKERVKKDEEGILMKGRVIFQAEDAFRKECEILLEKHISFRLRSEYLVLKAKYHLESQFINR